MKTRALKKRIVWALLPLCCLLLFSVTAAAEETATPADLAVSLKASSNTIAPDEYFSVEVSFTENKGFYRADLDLMYDPAQVTYVGADTAGSVFDQADVAVEGTNAGLVHLTVSPYKNLTEFIPKIYGEIDELTPYHKVNDEAADLVAVLTFRMNKNVQNAGHVTLDLTPVGKNIYLVSDNEAGYTTDGIVTKGGSVTLSYNPDAIHTHVLNNTTWQDHTSDGATCTEDGLLSHYFCVGCQTAYDVDKQPMESVIDPATGHEGTLSALIQAVPATCTEMGTKAHYLCSACDTIFDINMEPTTEKALDIPAKGHIPKPLDKKEPTCRDTGLTVGVGCAAEGCKVVLTRQEVIDRLPHRFSEWTIIRPATDVAEGIKRHTCIDCGAEEEDIIPIAKYVQSDVTNKKPLSKWVIALLCTLGVLLVIGAAIVVTGATSRRRSYDDEDDVFDEYEENRRLENRRRNPKDNWR